MPKTPTSEFDITQAPPSYFDGQIKALEKQLEEQLASAERTRSRLKWFTDGRHLFAESASPNGAPAAGAGASDELRAAQLAIDPASRITELLPPREMVPKPSLRQAILYTMLEKEPENGQEAEWQAREVIARLTEKGQMPSGNHAENSVRNMMRDMASREQLERPNYGTYRLPAHVRASGQIDPSGGP